MIDLMAASLKRLCQAPGCPACTARRQAEETYIDGFLWEGASDGYVRARLKQSLGFCPEHAWALQAREDTFWHDGLATSLVYQDLARQVLALLSDYAGNTCASRLARIRRWLVRLFSAVWPVPLPAAALARRLVPAQECPICIAGRDAQVRFIHTLLAGDENGEVRAALAVSDGLCLVHLRQALAEADEGTAAFLIETARGKLEPLVADLAEYQRKHAWHFRGEPKFDREQQAWIRVVAFFAGEASEPEADIVYQHRRRALEVFRADGCNG